MQCSPQNMSEISETLSKNLYSYDFNKGLSCNDDSYRWNSNIDLPFVSNHRNIFSSRSKYYAKEKAKLGFLSSLPNGVTATYEPSEGNIESSVVTIVAAADAAVGVYQIAPSATLNTKRKGTLLKLVVTTDQVAAK